MTWLIVLILVLGLIAAWPWIAESQRQEPGEEAFSGGIAELSQGTTRYRWFGPVRGPIVVAIHGLTTPSEAWDSVASELGKGGYRVLTYDLYGRGHSSNAEGRQNRRFHLQQLTDLLAHQRITGDVILMGYSMGGAIATAFAAENPDRANRLVLVATSGVEETWTRSERFAVRVPLLGDWLHHGLGMMRFRRQLAAWRGGPSEVEGIADIQIAQLSRKGFRPAVLSSLRGMLTERQEEEHRQLGRLDIPVIAIWGGKDIVIPLRAMSRLTEWNRNVMQDVIEEAGHGLPYTHGKETARIILGAMREIT